MASQEQVRAVLERRLHRDGGQVVAYPSFDDVVERLTTPGRKIYVGIDATSPHLHIGHTISLLLMRDLASLGHEIIILFGDFTSRIGDPTDKAAARTAQTEAEVEANLTTYRNQVEKILDQGTFVVRRNSEWLGSMTFSDVASLASRVTVQQMLDRDMFRERIKQEKPIHVSEFLYPLMQGYDSVAMEVDGEVGGNDQTFNMLVGRDLEKALLKKDKMVLPVRLLVDAGTGRKISKSEGGFIALNDEPGTIFEKVTRTIPDDMLETVFVLATDLPLETISENVAAAQESGQWRALSLELAETLVRMYYDEETAVQARKRYEDIGTTGAADVMKTVALTSNPDRPFTHIIAEVFGVSRSEAGRLIEQGGVSLNGSAVSDIGPVAIKEGDIVRIGSRQPIRVMFS